MSCEIFINSYSSPAQPPIRKQTLQFAGFSDARIPLLRQSSPLMITHATVRVPATSANLGPGFDCLGVALQIYNHVYVTRGGIFTRNSMLEEASASFFQESRVDAFDFDWKIDGEVPRSRGLGSSVTLRLGVLHALNALSGAPLDAHALYQICARLEGHPDNAAPAAFGGFTAARADGVYFRCEVSDEIAFVALIPHNEVETDASRVALPQTINRLDAASNTACASMITAAFASRNYHLLRGSMQDWLHQPWRQRHQVHLLPAIEAGVAAGALDGYLSGSGSTVICPTLQNPVAVAAAMQKIVPEAVTLILHADNIGTVVTQTF
jgi:homoserine kinase